MEQSPSKANWLSASQEIYGIYKCLPPVPHPSYWRSILIIFSHLCLGLPSGLFPSGFPIKTLYIPLLSPLHATCFIYLITQIVLGEQYRSIRYLLCSFLHSPVNIVPLRPKYSHQRPILKTPLCLHSSLNVSNEVSHPYKTTGKIIIPYIFIFLDSKLEDKRFYPEWYQAFPDFSLLIISSWTEFWFAKVVPKYLNCSTLSWELSLVFILWFCPAFWSWCMTI